MNLFDVRLLMNLFDVRLLINSIIIIGDELMTIVG